MKNAFVLIATILIVLLSTIVSSAQTKPTAYTEIQLTAQNIDGKMEYKPRMSASFSRSYDYGLGAWIYTMAKKNFGEVYAGPSYELAPWATIGIAGGLQTQGIFQSGAFVYFGNESLAMLAIAELDAHAEYLHKIVAEAYPVRWLGLGVYGKRFDGVGPYVELRLKGHVPLTIWTALTVYDLETRERQTKSLTALRMYF